MSHEPQSALPAAADRFLLENVDANGHPIPPWLAFPDVHRYSIGWRMGAPNSTAIIGTFGSTPRARKSEMNTPIATNRRFPRGLAGTLPGPEIGLPHWPVGRLI